MFELPKLPYAHDALAPVVSELTLRTHHLKHHAKYVETTNALLAGKLDASVSLETVVETARRTGDAKLFNNAGQALNHAVFWRSMTPGATRPSAGLRQAIEAGFGGLAELGERWVAEGAGHFGSGWVWLIARDGALAVTTTHDGDTAFGAGAVPLLVCDLWEHAYYLDYRNDRAAFLRDWWEKLVDWDFASSQFAASQGRGRAWRFTDGQAAPVA